MNHTESIKANDVIKLVENTVKVVFDIIASIIGMTGIKGYPKLFVMCHTINNGS